MHPKTSKIISVERSWDKKYDVQEQFITPKGVCFVFYVKFENGDIGKYLSFEKHPEKWAKGKTITYTIEIKKSGLYPEYVVKTAKPLSERAKKKIEKSKQETMQNITNPKDIKRICKSKCVDLATLTHVALKKQPTSTGTQLGLADFYAKWCVDVNPLDMAMVEGRMGNLKSAIDCMITFSEYPLKDGVKGIKTKEDVIFLSDLFYQYSLTD